MKLKFTSLLATLALMSGVSYAQTYTEDFEGVTTPALPAGWSQTSAATTGWKTNSGTISSANDWKTPAHTKYAVVDDWNNNENNSTSTLVTAPIDLSQITTPFLTLDYYYVGAVNGSNNTSEKFKVKISTDGGANWTTLTKTDNQALSTSPYEWLSAAFDLTAYQTATAALIGFEYDDNGDKLIGAAVDNIKIFTPPANDIAITAVTPVEGTPEAFGLKGTNLTIGGTVSNLGTTTITSFKVHVDDGTGNPIVSTVSGVSIAPFTSADFTAPTQYTLPSSMGYSNLDVSVELTGDVNNSNDNTSTKVGSADYLPSKKIFIEEGTGTWCGWCPRGHVYMDSVHNTYPNSFSLVAVHNNSVDPMRDATYDNYLVQNFVNSFPGMAVDRAYETDPSDLITVYNERKDLFGFADITLTDVAATGFNYSLKVSVKPAIDLSGDYRLLLVLTEDDVHDASNTTYAQTNYYSSTQANLPLQGAGLDWQQEASKVPASKMYYQHVARMAYPSPTGAPSSLPTTMSANTSYDYTFNAAISPAYNRTKMHAIVAVIRNSDGVVLNSQNLSIPVGIQDAKATGISQMNIFPNPATSDVNVAVNLAQASSVSVQMFDVMGRLVNETPAQNMTAGENSIQINTANLPAGVYSVRVQTETGSVTKQLSIIK